MSEDLQVEIGGLTAAVERLTAALGAERVERSRLAERARWCHLAATSRASEAHALDAGNKELADAWGEAADAYEQLAEHARRELSGAALKGWAQRAVEKIDAWGETGDVS